MQAKTSKQVTDRQKICQFLLTALETQGPLISSMLNDRLRPSLHEGDVEPIPQHLHIALGRFLETNVGATVRADEELYAANAKLGNLRKERRAAIQRVISQIIHLRTLMVALYQAPLLDDIGLGTATTRAPMPLLRQADRITETFASDQLAAFLGEPFVAGGEVPQAPVVELGTRAEVLRGILRHIDEAVRLRDVAQDKRKALQADHDLAYTHTARTFESFCRLVGKADLAERVRKTIRRVRQAPSDAAGDGAESGPTGTGVETPGAAPAAEGG